MKAKIYNLKGDSVGEVEVSDAIFGHPWKADLVHQALTAQMANRRRSIAHAKNRGEVSGGGKKPWRQKGTGRARHGSIRSPIWVGGGAAHGPKKERNFSKGLNKKMLRLAIHSALSKKIASNDLKIVEDFKFKEPKTKLLAETIKNFQVKSALFVTGKSNPAIARMSRNIPKTKSIPLNSLNLVDLLAYNSVFFDKEAATTVK